MSKIKELLNDKKSVLVFDVDGVLALMEFGEYNHYTSSDDDEWISAIDKGINFYTEDKVSKTMQSFLKDKDMNRVYVITTSGSNKEGEHKKDFVNKYYNILKENVYYVDKNTKKTNVIKQIKSKYPKLEDKYIVMIDDTVNILNDIMRNTEFSTAHISCNST